MKGTLGPPTHLPSCKLIYACYRFRLSTPAFGVLRTAVNSTTIRDGTATKPVGKGDTIFADFVTAGLDPDQFPDPEEIKLDRPIDCYIHHGWGQHSCLGRAIVTTAGACVLRVLGRLRNVRRAPGPSGEMKSKMVNGAFKVYLPEDGSEWTPFPCSKCPFLTFYVSIVERESNGLIS